MRVNATAARAIVFAIITCICAFPAAAQVNLRFATVEVAGTPAYDEGLGAFARALETDSGGRITVDQKPLGGHGRPTELLGLVEAGRIEMAATVQGYSPNRFPRSSVMELPLIHASAESGTRAMWTLFEEGLIAEDYRNVKVLALYVLPPYGIFTVDKPVRTLRDLRGLRVRAPSTTVGLGMAKLGIVPLGLPVTMLSDTLADDSIDGIAYSWDELAMPTGMGGGPMLEQVRHLMDINLAAPAAMIVINRRIYDGLAADLKAVVDKHSGLALSLANARVRDKSESAVKQKLSTQRSYEIVRLNAEQQAELKRRVEPLYGQWRQTMTAQNIDGERLLTRVRALAQSN